VPKCRVCLRPGSELSDRGLCPHCEDMAQLVRERLDGAAKSKLKPPKRVVKCELCGTPMKPILFRPEGPWTHYCVKGCYGCPGCLGVFRYDQTCTCWSCSKCSSVRRIPAGKRCPMCGATQREVETGSVIARGPTPRAEGRNCSRLFSRT
jgi:hypothetical protein